MKASATISHIIKNEKPYDLFGEIDQYKPDFIGMYLGTISYYEGVELAESIRASYPNIPIMVGGGIKNKKTADNIINAGASYIVIGTLLEECNDINFLKEINKTIHGF